MHEDDIFLMMTLWVTQSIYSVLKYSLFLYVPIRSLSTPMDIILTDLRNEMGTSKSNIEVNPRTRLSTNV